MDQERAWQRITEAARVLAQANGVDLPNGLEVSDGNPWQRNKQRREALKGFLPKIQGFDERSADLPLEMLANQMDNAALPLLDVKAGNGKTWTPEPKPTEVLEETEE